MAAAIGHDPLGDRTVRRKLGLLQDTYYSGQHVERRFRGSMTPISCKVL